MSAQTKKPLLRQYVITHKAFTPPTDKSYVPLQVGPGEDLGYLRDNTGKNIAIKNPNWCELTGLYWIWKNDADSDVLGLCHYRRYFGKNRPFSKDEILNRLDGHDMLIAEFEPYRQSVYEQYCIDSGYAKDLDALREIIQELYPDDVPAFDAIMKQGGISQYNMMVCDRKRFMDYCSWLFSLLERLESQVDLSGYTPYQKRIYGFLAERLLNVYVLARNLDVVRLPVWQSEMSAKEKARLALRRIKNRMIFASRKDQA